jgi:cGMP-dependent protein kinase 2
MDEEKAPANVNRRMTALKGETPLRAATFEIRAGPGGAGDASSVTVARGSCSGSTFGDAVRGEGELRVVLSEGTLLGGGASGTVRRVDLVDDRLGGGAITSFALKRMRKTFVMSTPEHIFCERNVTREVTHWACMRQHASFKD